MAFSGTQITRLGLYGGPRGLYGSFAGKEFNEAVVSQFVVKIVAHGVLMGNNPIGVRSL